MNKLDIDKAYVSPYDYFFHEFDTRHSLSASQQAEIKKHQRIAKLRDEVVSTEPQESWMEFL